MPPATQQRRSPLGLFLGKTASRLYDRVVQVSIVSHAAAWASPDPATAVFQQQAKRWMDEQRPLYDVVTSQVVIDEAGMGDPDAAARRLQMLDGIPVLPVYPGVLRYSVLGATVRPGCLVSVRTP